MKLIVVVSLLSTVSAAPYFTDYLSDLWYGYTPRSVRRALETVLDEGVDLVGDIAKDLQKDFDDEVVDKLTEAAYIGEKTFHDLHYTVYSFVDIMSGGQVTEEGAEYERERIVQLRLQFQELAANLTMEDEESRSALEARVQYMLKEMKLLLAEDDLAESFFDRLDRIKFQTQRTRAVLLESLSEMGDIFKYFFDAVYEKEKTYRNGTILGNETSPFPDNDGYNGVDAWRYNATAFDIYNSTTFDEEVSNGTDDDDLFASTTVASIEFDKGNSTDFNIDDEDDGDDEDYDFGSGDYSDSS